MKRICLCFVGVLFLVLAGCEQDHESVTKLKSTALELESSQVESSDSLQTGIYLVNRWTIEEGALDPLFEDEIYFEYREDDFQELQDAEPEPVKYVALSRTEYIPMELASEPQRQNGDDGRAQVALTFSNEMIKKLTTFSRNYLGRQIALVIDGDVITMHKIRSVLTGPGLQISRCTDEGCELILAKLKM